MVSNCASSRYQIRLQKQLRVGLLGMTLLSVVLRTSHLMSLNVDVLELSVVGILRLLHADLLLSVCPECCV